MSRAWRPGVRLKDLSVEGTISQPSASGRTTVCRSCGALVGAGEAACAVCGAQVGGGVEAARLPRHEVETMRFARAILTRPATFTFIFLIANIFLYLLMALSGGADGEVLVAYGAKRNDLINAGEWWRLVAPVFLHVSMPGAVIPFHLLVNMYGLWILGPYVERLYGSAKFVFFWIVTGIAGFVASYYSVQPEWQTNAVGRFLFKSYDQAAAGASGALFGLVGVLLVFGIKFRHELPEGFRRAFGFGLLPMVLINIFIGYLGRGFIDNAGHMGGFVAGILLALFVGYKRPGERGPISIFWHAVQIALLLLVVLSFVQVARHLGDARPNFENMPEQLFDSQAENAVAYFNAISGGRQTFAAALKGKAGNIEQALAALDRAPQLDSQTEQLRNELKGLIVRARDFNAGAPKERNSKRRQQELNQIFADYSQWQQRLEEWIKTAGQNYGIIIHEQPQTPPREQQDGARQPEVNIKK